MVLFVATAMYMATLRVPPPWQVTDLHTTSSVNYFCPFLVDAATGATCLQVRSSETVAIWTTDPNPVARDFTIEEGSTGCP
jgi:hypothetical protein